MAKRRFKNRKGRKRFVKKRPFQKGKVAFKKGRPFKRKRGGFGKGKFNAQQRMKKMCEGVAPGHFKWSNVDKWDLNDSTNTVANQVYIASQQLSAQAGSASASTIPLGLMDQCITGMILGGFSGVDETGANFLSRRAIVSSYKTRMTIQNIHSGPVMLTHYRCVARQDISASLSSESSLKLIVENGFADATSALVGGAVRTSPMTSTTWGATLFQNPRFCRWFKIVKVKKYTILPARMIKIGYSMKKYRMIDQATHNAGVLPDADGSTVLSKQLLRGSSVSVFCVQGMFASNTAGDTGFEFGIGNATLGVISEIDVVYHYAQPTTPQNSAQVQAGGFTTGSAFYPAPIVQNQPISVITATTRTYPTNDQLVVPDLEMTA